MRHSVVLQLIANIAIPILTPRRWNIDGSNVDFLSLRCISVIPLRTTERASDVVTHLRSRPLVEACFVDMIAASGTAPHNLSTLR